MSAIALSKVVTNARGLALQGQAGVVIGMWTTGDAISIKVRIEDAYLNGSGVNEIQRGAVEFDLTPWDVVAAS